MQLNLTPATFACLLALSLQMLKSLCSTSHHDKTEILALSLDWSDRLTK